MPNHFITPTGDTQTHNQTIHLTPMLAKFKAGDSVLCPSLGNDVYTLAQHGDTVNFKHKVYFVGGQGEQQVFRPDGTEYKGGEQVIFHNTPANREAIATLYHNADMIQAGDIVLYPSLGNGVHRLAQSPTKTHNQNNSYLKHPNGNLVFFRYDGRLVEYSEELPVIFHNTPANRKAIATLYGVTYDTMPADINPQAGEPQKAIDAILDALGRLRPHPAQTDHDIAGVIFSLKPLSEQLITATSNTPTHAQAVLLGNCVNRYLAAFTTEEHIDDNQWDELSGDITASVNAVYQSILWGALSCTH